MVYRINIPAADRNALKTTLSRFKWWILLEIVILVPLLVLPVSSGTIKEYANALALIAIFSIPVLLVFIISAIKATFWKEIALANNWEYEESSDPSHEAGIMFRQGRTRSISHVVRGKIEDRAIRFFSYQFTIGSGKYKRVFEYTVFAFKFNGSFPHIYLNRKFDFYSVSVGEKISLPSEFEKKFILSAPKEYEVEALEIFTPEVLADFLDKGFDYDVEFVDHEMLVYAPGNIYSVKKLEEELYRALELEDLLDERLDRFKFSQIGDRPYVL